MREQYIYDEAERYYKDTIYNIKELGLLLEKITKYDFSTDVALFQFDIILQYILLVQAIDDGEINQFEHQFINLITERGDLLKLINVKENLNLSWEDLELLNIKISKGIIVTLLPEFKTAVSSFVNCIAVGDAATPEKDYFKIIKTNTLNILKCLARIDGYASENEVEFGKATFNTLFGETYMKVKNEFERKLQDNNN